MPGSEIFSPFFGHPHAFFSLWMSSRSARSLPCTSQWKKEEVGRVVVVVLLIWKIRGDSVARRARRGKVKVKHVLKTEASHQGFLERTMRATKRCTSSGCMGLVTRCLFMKNWALARVALSCYMALDMLCQEMHGPWLLLSRCHKALCHSTESLSLSMDGL